MVGTAVALRNMRWVGHVARRHKRNVRERQLEGKAHLQEVSVEGASISCVRLTAQYSMATVTVWCTPRGAEPPVAQECRCSHAQLHIWDSLSVCSPKGHIACASPPRYVNVFRELNTVTVYSCTASDTHTHTTVH